MTDTRVWLVTGATSGFGRTIVDAALARGEAVVATSRQTEGLQDIADHERVLVTRLDVTDAAERQAAVAAALERFGRIDVLVNNAGRTQVGAVEETTDDELRALFELHFFGPAALTRLVLPLMRRQGGGAIVQMSSVGGQVTAPGFGAYCATKFALEGLTETLRTRSRASASGRSSSSPAPSAPACSAGTRRTSRRRCPSTHRRSAPPATTSAATTARSPATPRRPRRPSSPCSTRRTHRSASSSGRTRSRTSGTGSAGSRPSLTRGSRRVGRRRSTDSCRSPAQPDLAPRSGGGGIRTRGPRERTPVFKTGAFDRSATPPRAG